MVVEGKSKGIARAKKHRSALNAAGVFYRGQSGEVTGGLTRPGGAVVGGFMMGVLENLAGEYVIGSELKLTFALVVIVAVLLFKPSGLFGRTVVQRV